MRPEICRKGSISKRSDGYWLGTIYYLNEYGQRKRKAFGGKLKKIVERKMTDFIAEFNRKAAEYEYGYKFLKDALLEYMKEIKFFSVRRITYDRCEELQILMTNRSGNLPDCKEVWLLFIKMNGLNRFYV